MSHTHTSSPAEDALPASFPTEPGLTVVVAEAMTKAAKPFLIFSACLAVLLLLSLELLLPHLARVQVSGQSWDEAGLRAHRASLTADILTSERERRDGALSVRDDQYQTLKFARMSALSLERVTAEISAQAGAAAQDRGRIVIDAVDYDLAAKTVALRGDVRDAGPRSMTVLAAFVSLLGKSPLVASVEPPRFERVDDAAGGPHSPFAFTLTLR